MVVEAKVAVPVKVGDAEKTRLPLPVSSVMSVASFSEVSSEVDAMKPKVEVARFVHPVPFQARRSPKTSVIAPTSESSSILWLSASRVQVVPLQVNSPKSAFASSVAPIVEPKSETFAESAPSTTVLPVPMVRTSLMMPSPMVVEADTRPVEFVVRRPWVSARSTVPPKTALPVVVAPPLMVRPPAPVPLPIVDDAFTRIPYVPEVVVGESAEPKSTQFETPSAPVPAWSLPQLNFPVAASQRSFEVAETSQSASPAP